MTASIRVAQTNLTAYNVPHLGSPTLTIASPYSRTDDEAPQISENMTTAIESAYLDVRLAPIQLGRLGTNG